LLIHVIICYAFSLSPVQWIIFGALFLASIRGGPSRAVCWPCGWVLVVSPSGKLFGMPLSMLDKSPFADFLIPGIILFLVLGLAPCLLVFALLKKPVSALADWLNVYPDMHWAWTRSIYVAFALIIWLQAEMMFLQAVGWLHTAYMLLAVAILFVALLPQVRCLYQK
jgi:hypothetical protein